MMDSGSSGAPRDSRAEDTSSVRVQGLPPDVDQEKLSLYFESSRKSGGGTVEDVKLERETGTAFITFQEPQGICCLIITCIC